MSFENKRMQPKFAHPSLAPENRLLLVSESKQIRASFEMLYVFRIYSNTI